MKNNPSDPSEIRIDILQIPVKKLTDAMFLLCLADVKKKLSDPNELRAICIHEAAHLFYMIKAGMRNPVFTGPKIIYNPKTDKFDRYGGTVRCTDRNDALLSTLTVGDWAFKITKAHAAGGVAIRSLANHPNIESGDSEDRDNFDRAYAQICAEFSDQTVKGDDMWCEARRILGIELQEESRRKYIEQLADKIKPDLFKS